MSLRCIFIAFAFLSTVHSINAQQVIPADLDTAPLNKEIVPVKDPDTALASVALDKKMLNGYYVLFNKQRKKIKDGIFKDNKLIDGKNYIYDDTGTLRRIELYKEGKYVQDLPTSDGN